MAKQPDVDADLNLADRVAREQDDVLSTILLVKGNDTLVEHLFDQLVDLLVESMFCDLQQGLAEGRLSREAYAREVATLAHQCHVAGLLPLPGK